MNRRYFIRDDDVGELTAGLRYFVELFLSYGIPVSYQIIPARLTSDCAAFLLEVERSHPDLIEFGQHGLHHAMRLNGRQLKREFGPERAYEDQRTAISDGLRILHERLGTERKITIFTPPQHKYDRNTIIAAADVGHDVFSAASYNTYHHRLAYAMGRSLGWSSIRHHGITYNGRVRPEAPIRELSISVAIDNGRAVTCPPAALDQQIRAADHLTPPVGFMLHHALYEQPPRRATLAKLAEQLAARGASRFEKLGELARRLGREGTSPISN